MTFFWREMKDRKFETYMYVPNVSDHPHSLLKNLVDDLKPAPQNAPANTAI